MDDTSNQAEAALVVEAVSFSYSRKRKAPRLALDEVGFRVNSGDFKVLLGINGAGKSTLFSILSYQFASKTGKIVIHGKNLNENSMAALRHIGVVFQQQTLDPGLTVAQNLSYYAALQGLSKSQAQARISALLSMVSLSRSLHRTVATLSGGERRRIELARALIHSPRILLMDEATTGLDVKSRYEFIATLRALCQQQGLSVLWATHLVDEVLETDPVIVLHEGRILAEVRADALIKQCASSSIREAFLQITGQPPLSFDLADSLAEVSATTDAANASR